MRKGIGILVCLLMVCAQLSAVTYQTYKPSRVVHYPSSTFRSTSVYMTESRTYGVGTIANAQTLSTVRATGSLAAISASNFEALNSESQTFNTLAGPRRGRADEDEYGGTGAIGDQTYHSPVGNTPWVWFLLLAAGYVIWRKLKVKKELA